MASGGGSHAPVFRGSRFPVLSGIAGILQVVGWLAVAGGGIMVLVQVAALSSSAGRGNTPLVVLFALLPSIAVALGGLLLVAIGEAARVVVSMENNTYRMVQQPLPDHRGRLGEGE